MGVIEDSKQCDWTCPECKGRCGGVVGHGGMHQCPTHYNPPEQKYGFARFLYNEEHIRRYG